LKIFYKILKKNKNSKKFSNFEGGPKNPQKWPFLALFGRTRELTPKKAIFDPFLDPFLALQNWHFLKDLVNVLSFYLDYVFKL
jgi:hypothetical protein